MEPGSLRAVSAASVVVGGRASQSVSIEKASSAGSSGVGSGGSQDQSRGLGKALAVAGKGKPSGTTDRHANQGEHCMYNLT